MRKTVLFFMIMVTVLGLIPVGAEAYNPAQVEYITFNSFDSIAPAFKRIGLIFSDAGYQGLFFTICVLGIVFAAAGFYMKAMSGMKGSALSWATPALIGAMIYLAFVVPKGTITVYDRTLNKMETIGGIPIGITMIAGLTNRMEVGLIDIIKTSGDPTQYEYGANGIGIYALLNVMRTGVASGDPNLDRSLNSYINQCFYFELGREGSTVDFTALKKDNTDFMPFLAQAASPAVYTVQWNSTSGSAGVTMTCQSAWTALQTSLNSASTQDSMLKRACSSAGIDSTNTTAYGQCKSIIEGHISKLYKGEVTAGATAFMRQAYLGQRLAEVAEQNNVNYMSNFNIGVGGVATATSMNEWLPVLKGAFTAVIFGLLPFIAILIPTPIFGKAVKAALALIGWIAVWGVTDAVAHQFIIDHAVTLFEQVYQGKLGYDALMMLPDPLTKTMGLYGYIRGAGMMLAGLIVTMMANIPGYMMAGLAAGATGTIDNSSSSAGQTLSDPAKQQAQIQAQAQGQGMRMFNNEHSFSNRAAAAFGGQQQSFAGGMSFQKTTATMGGMDNVVNAMSNQQSMGLTTAAGQMAAHNGNLASVGASANMAENTKLSQQRGVLLAQQDTGMDYMHSQTLVARVNAAKEAGVALGTQSAANNLTGGNVTQLAAVQADKNQSKGYIDADEMNKFAAANNIDRNDLLRASARSMSVSVDAAMAKKLGLSGGAGQYNLSWDGKGNYTFTDQKSGTQYQRGTFGKEGSDTWTGHKTTYDDSKNIISGTKVDTRNLNYSGNHTISGNSQSGVFQTPDGTWVYGTVGLDPRTGRPMGSTTALHTNETATPEGATVAKTDSVTGENLISKSEKGNTGTTYDNHKSYKKGTVSSGSLNKAVGHYAGKLGLNSEEYEYYAATLGDGLGSIGKVLLLGRGAGILGGGKGATAVMQAPGQLSLPGMSRTSWGAAAGAGVATVATGAGMSFTVPSQSGSVLDANNPGSQYSAPPSGGDPSGHVSTGGGVSGGVEANSSPRRGSSGRGRGRGASSRSGGSGSSGPQPQQGWGK